MKSVEKHRFWHAALFVCLLTLHKLSNFLGHLFKAKKQAS